MCLQAGGSVFSASRWVWDLLTELIKTCVVIFSRRHIVASGVQQSSFHHRVLFLSDFFPLFYRVPTSTNGFSVWANQNPLPIFCWYISILNLGAPNYIRRQATTAWGTWSTGNCARNLNLTTWIKVIYTTLNPYWRMRQKHLSETLRDHLILARRANLMIVNHQKKKRNKKNAEW